jgi:ABC-type glycerol-3-phosphate transport system substrate-binding protein
MRLRILRLTGAVLAAALGLGGCGGGIQFGWGFGNGDGSDDTPSVTITTAQTSVAPGATLRIVAAASDQDGIESVAFYLLDASGNASALLGSDGVAPYEWNLVVPDDGRSEVRVFARATDAVGERGDSAVIAVPVAP